MNVSTCFLGGNADPKLVCVGVRALCLRLASGRAQILTIQSPPIGNDFPTQEAYLVQVEISGSFASVRHVAVNVKTFL